MFRAEIVAPEGRVGIFSFCNAFFKIEASDLSKPELLRHFISRDELIVFTKHWPDFLDLESKEFETFEELKRYFQQIFQEEAIKRQQRVFTRDEIREFLTMFEVELLIKASGRNDLDPDFLVLVDNELRNRGVIK